MPDPTSAAYWKQQDEALVKVLQPVVISAATKAARLAFDDLVLQFGAELGVSWSVVNEAAIAWAKGYTFDLVSGINDTSQAFLSENIAAWIESGEPLDVLIEKLAPFFGTVRAELVASTEVTRIFAEANLTTWRESGVVKGKRWFASVDDLVCPICAPLHNTVVELDGSGFLDALQSPPAHPRCRCWLIPADVGV